MKKEKKKSFLRSRCKIAIKNDTQITSFLQNWKKIKREIFAFCVITFAPKEEDIDPIDLHVPGKIMARKGVKKVIYASHKFCTTDSRLIFKNEEKWKSNC